MSKENVDAVRQSLDGWNRHDFDAFVARAHPEIEWISEIAARIEGSDTVYRGVPGLRRFWDESRELWDVAIEVIDVRDLGDTVLALARLRTRGEASGIDLEGPIAYLLEFEDGLVRRARAYLDVSEALRAAGLSE